MKFNFFRPEPEDLAKIDRKDCFSMGEISCAEDLIKMSLMTKDSICLAFTHEEKIFGIAGSYRNWKGSAQAWAVFDKSVDLYPLALTHACFSLINYAAKEQELKRLSINVKSDYEKGNEFVKTLGFELEGKMRNYLPCGSDANLYARIFP